MYSGPVHKIIIKNFSNLCYVPNAIQNLILHLLFLENLWINIVDTTEIAFRKLNYKVDSVRSEQGNAKLLSAEKCSLGLRDLKKLNLSM